MEFKDEAVKFFKALGDPTRYEIVCMLLQSGEVSCTECSEHFKLSNPALSHHYRVLQNAGVVSGRKEGAHVYYKLNAETLKRFVPGFADVHTQCFEEVTA